MRERLTTVGGALLSLFFLYALLFGDGGEAPVTRPWSSEPGVNGYLGLMRWFDGEGVRTHSLRKRLDGLQADELAGAGNVLMTTVPYRNAAEAWEFELLEPWIRHGNTLLVMAALDDTPAWTVGTTRLHEDLKQLTGLEFDAHRDAEGEFVSLGDAFGAVTIPLEPVGGHPLTQGIRRLQLSSDAATSLWQPDYQAGRPPVLRLARQPRHGVDAIWQWRLGEGQVILVGSASLLVNGQLGAADNHRLAANIAHYHLGRSGTWIFDDYHQGLSSLYDPEAFFADPRLWATVGFFVAAWLIYLVGASDRLLSPVRRVSGPQQIDFVDAVGGLMARKLSKTDMGLMMFEDWFQAVTRRRSGAAHHGGAPPHHSGAPPPPGEEPWRYLARIPTLPDARIALLRRHHQRLQANRPVDLQRLHNDLRRAGEDIG